MAAVFWPFCRFGALASKILILEFWCKYKKVGGELVEQLLYFKKLGGTNILGPRGHNWSQMGPGDCQFGGFGALQSKILVLELWCKYKKVEGA